MRVSTAIFRVLHVLFDVAAFVVIFGFLALFAAQFDPNPHGWTLAVLRVLHRLGDPAVRTVSHWFHWHRTGDAHPNFAALALAVAAFAVKSVIDSILDAAAFRAAGRVQKGTPHFGTISDELSAVTAERDREQLLKRYREIEATLKTAASKRCTFLSIDVVGSTKMKSGHSSTEIASTFRAYEDLVKRAFRSYSVWKYAWTPDGVMACFLNVDLAVEAARAILANLGGLNADHNRLETPFRIRCGINSGNVSIFEDSALERIADFTIDLAGHMQKAAGEDEIWMSEAVVKTLAKPEGFVDAGAEVDGLRAFAWSIARSDAPVSAETDES